MFKAPVHKQMIECIHGLTSESYSLDIRDDGSEFGKSCA